MIKVKAPGRINIIGGHTDYNDGFVLPAAIDKSISFSLIKNGSEHNVTVTASKEFDTFSFDLTHFSPLSTGWYNYVMGVVKEIQKTGAKITGFDAEFSGDVPIGSGMSSSAALECSLAYGLNELFNLGLDKWQLIKISQAAEHNFVGTKCGIMDQFASVMGKKDHVMLLDCRTLEFEYIPFDLKNYQVLLLDTNVEHKLASSEYNTRRSECEDGIQVIRKTYDSVKNLRDVSPEMLQTCAINMPQNVFKRCHHIITDNQRVHQATQALKSGNLVNLGQLLYQSHVSLQKNYDVSCAELDYLVQLSLSKDYVLGSRMMGGGFGGCTINIIEQNWAEEFIEYSAENYRKQFGIDLTPHDVSIEDGASRIN